MRRSADYGRAAIIGFAVATLFVFVLWGAYRVLDDEWDPASYGGRQYSCGSPEPDPEYKPTHRLPGAMNGNPVYVDRLPTGNYDPVLVQVRIGKR